MDGAALHVPLIGLVCIGCALYRSIDVWVIAVDGKMRLNGVLPQTTPSASAAPCWPPFVCLIDAGMHRRFMLTPTTVPVNSLPTETRPTNKLPGWTGSKLRSRLLKTHLFQVFLHHLAVYCLVGGGLGNSCTTDTLVRSQWSLYMRD